MAQGLVVRNGTRRSITLTSTQTIPDGALFTKPTKCDVLVVGGGGGGGLQTHASLGISGFGGGGGAGGGVIEYTNWWAAGSLVVTVGAGGAPGVPGSYSTMYSTAPIGVDSTYLAAPGGECAAAPASYAYRTMYRYVDLGPRYYYYRNYYYGYGWNNSYSPFYYGGYNPYRYGYASNPYAYSYGGYYTPGAYGYGSSSVNALVQSILYNSGMADLDNNSSYSDYYVTPLNRTHSVIRDYKQVIEDTIRLSSPDQLVAALTSIVQSISPSLYYNYYDPNPGSYYGERVGYFQRYDKRLVKNPGRGQYGGSTGGAGGGLVSDVNDNYYSSDSTGMAGSAGGVFADGTSTTKYLQPYGSGGGGGSRGTNAAGGVGQYGAGNGASSVSPATAALVNTGGGGGGSSGYQLPSAGGSGVVIISWDEEY